MKTKLIYEELEGISGGQILRSTEGSFIVRVNETRDIKCEDLRTAVEWEWRFFGDEYTSRGFVSINQLEVYYKAYFERSGDVIVMY